MKCGFLRPVVFQPNLKQVLTVRHVKLTIVIVRSWLAGVCQVKNACGRLLGTKEAKELHKLSTILATLMSLNVFISDTRKKPSPVQ